MCIRDRFFVVAAATADDIAAQNIVHKANPTLIQSLNTGDLDDSECHAWKAPNYVSRRENDSYLQHFAIKIYLAIAAGHLIPASPAMFFLPDRAPPVSSL